MKSLIHPLNSMEANVVAAHVSRALWPRIPEANFGQCLAIGIYDDSDQLRGGVVFHNHDPVAKCMEVSTAVDAPGWGTKGNLAKIFGYAFDHADMNYLLARIRDSSMPAGRHIFERIGCSTYTIEKTWEDRKNTRLLIMQKEHWQASRFNERNNNG